jgi:1,4-dihydroxy-2-naphthoyl-CoA synthase
MLVYRRWVTLAARSCIDATALLRSRWQIMAEVHAACSQYERSNNVGCIIITGNGKAFAAGADIKEMVSKVRWRLRSSLRMRDAVEAMHCRHRVVTSTCADERTPLLCALRTWLPPLGRFTTTSTTMT